MSDPITCQIGGELITLPPIMNFATLERCWPAIKAMNAADDYTMQISAAIALISGALISTRPELTIPEIKNRVRINLNDGSDERDRLWGAANELIKISGLVRTGEASPPAPPAA